MRYGRVTKACIVVIALGPDPFREPCVDPLDVPLAADRTWVLGRVAHGPPSGGRIRPLAAFRDLTVGRIPLRVKGSRLTGLG